MASAPSSVTPWKRPRLAGTVASPNLGEIPRSGCEAAVVTPRHSPRILAYAKPSPLIGFGLFAKAKRYGIKRKCGPTKVYKGCKKHSRVDANGQDVVDADSHDECVDQWKTRVEVVLFVQIERPIFTMPRASGVRSEGAPTIASSQNAPLGVPGEVPGGSSARMKASSGISSEAAKGSFDDASVSLGRIDGIMKTVCGEIERVPTTVERLSRVDGILPPDSGFDAESSKDDLSIEAKILVEIRQSVVHLRTSFGMFKQLQDAHCKPFEDETRVVISQIERSGDVDKGHGQGNEDRFGECPVVDDWKA
ncbi:hypothetical protein ZWY2020_054692 [Hordeum vulgare]|nr:hypothetical protein ZWY2020_054692 [Hordeum vulgare]